ncbi:type IV pilus biogenesis/stability protein PilW [Glaciecola sp. SC05]|uniref:type IV pilus biogenesis/stability protein PilW n=1 Tax=Glaciecola sp. SC05 TaxID=1987355 RepID=UPI003529577B
MLRVLICILAVLSLSACVSEPKDPSFIGARAFDAEEAAKTRVSLGLTYLKNGNFSQAKFNLDKALEFAPRNGQAHFAMAFYYQQVDEAELAEESYEKALDFSRNDPDIVNSYGAFLCREGKYERAKGYFLKAVNSKNYVSTAETYENLAICSQNQGKNQEAIEFFNSALNHQPTRPQSLYLLSRLYIEEQQFEEAKRILFKYERNAPISAETLYMQYQIAQGLDDTKTAVGYGEILKSMFPDHPNTEKYLAQMGKFKPSATITRKIRTQANNQDPMSLNAEVLADVFSETDKSVQASVPSTSVGDSNDDMPQIVIIDTTKPDLQADESPIENPSSNTVVVNNETESDENVLAEADISMTQVETSLTGTNEAETTQIQQALTQDVVAVVSSLKSGESPAGAVAMPEQSDLPAIDVEQRAEEFLVEQKIDDSIAKTPDSSVDASLDEPDMEAALAAALDSESGASLPQQSDSVVSASDDDYHTVQAKENLYRISLKYNVKMKTLLEWNGLADASAIQTGTKLRVRDPNTND